MKLLTKEILKKFEAVGEQDIPDPLVVCKFFDPCGSWTWYATAYNPADRVFFGMVHGDEHELGYFSLDELESVRGPLGLGIERDLHFTPKRLSEIESKAAAV